MVVKKIKVLIVDDHPVFREGLCRVISEQEDMEVSGQAGDAEESLKLARELAPDVAIIDIALPGLDGIELAKQLKTMLASIGILMLSAYGYEGYVLSSLRVGAAGYLLKDTCPREIVNAVRSIHAGEAVFQLKSISPVLRRLSSDHPVDTDSLPQLAKRELDVLKLAARGKTNKEIAVLLGISERTVQAHIIKVYRKFEVNSRTAAVLRALHEGWLTLEDLSWRRPSGRMP